MAVTFAELASSPRIEKDSRERSFLATGSTSENEVETAAYAQLPATDGGLGNLEVTVEPIGHELGMWEVTARYRPETFDGPPAVGESAYQFEIGTTTAHILRSLYTTKIYKHPEYDYPPYTLGSIGLNADGIDGCDILVPESRFSETHYLSSDFVTPAYRRLLRSMVGKVNNAPFRDHNAGEVLLSGIRGGKRASDNVWELTFDFATSDNATGLEVGEITGIRKKGWEYLWVYYEPSVVGDRLIPKPIAVYIETVYRYDDFVYLGIGE